MLVCVDGGHVVVKLPVKPRSLLAQDDATGRPLPKGGYI